MAFWVESLSGSDGSLLCPIEEAVARQNFLFKQKCAGNPLYLYDYILLAEHPPVYTYVPRRGKVNKLFREKSQRGTSLPAPLVDVGRRAGSITYHGPGQIVCYFVIHIAEAGIGFDQFGRFIDSILIDLLKYFRIEGYPKPPHLPEEASGVWITDHDGNEKKIASRGLNIRLGMGITRFGFALNVHTNLSYFDYIYPCGLDITMTSMRECSRSAVPTTHEVSRVLKEIMLERFRSIKKEAFRS